MSQAYDEYLKNHIDNVSKGYQWLITHFNDISEKMSSNTEFYLRQLHDASKYSDAEYSAYDDYFYGNKSHNVLKDFNYAWLHHIHHNPHHWQYWVLQHDDEPEEALEMPFEYVIEMICDWWSFSWKSGNLYEIFNWYEQHKNMKLHPNTRRLVESILARIKKELDKANK